MAVSNDHVANSGSVVIYSVSISKPLRGNSTLLDQILSSKELPCPEHGDLVQATQSRGIYQ